MGQVGAGVQTLPNSVLPPGGHGAGMRSPDPGERMAKGRSSQLRPLSWSAPVPGAGNIHAAAARVTENGPAEGEDARGRTDKSGAAEDGAARTTPAKHEAAKTEAAKTEAAKSGTAEDGPAKLGTAKLETTKHEAAKHEAAKHEDRAARDEAARTETATSEEDTSSEAAPEVMHVLPDGTPVTNSLARQWARRGGAGSGSCPGLRRAW